MSSETKTINTAGGDSQARRHLSFKTPLKYLIGSALFLEKL